MPRRTARLLAILGVSVLWLPVALASRLLVHLGAERRGLLLAAAAQRRWARALLGVIGVEVHVEGPREGLARPSLVVANHLSYLDILVLAAHCPGRFVAKSEIAGWPVLGPLAATVGTIFVHQGRRRDVLRVERAMARTLAAGIPVLLFPEGHSTRGVRVDRLHSSLFESAVRTGLPCRAVALGYETPHDPWAPAATVCWWGGMTFWRHVLGVLGLAGVRARLRVAEEARSSTDRKALAAALHADLARHFQPVRQAPIPPGYPWPELFAEPTGAAGASADGAVGRS